MKIYDAKEETKTLKTPLSFVALWAYVPLCAMPPGERAPSRELSLVIATKLCFMGSYSDVLALPTN